MARRSPDLRKGTAQAAESMALRQGELPASLYPFDGNRTGITAKNIRHYPRAAAVPRRTAQAVACDDRALDPHPGGRARVDFATATHLRGDLFDRN